jgi:hypothetical protein
MAVFGPFGYLLDRLFAIVGVRQLLADKISGNQVGIWLLAPEHLRLGTWDLLCAWSQCDGQTL